MRAKLTKGTRLEKFIADKIADTSLSQRAIADAVGYKNQNMITMLKQGDAKLALDKVAAMARILSVDPRHLFRLALEQSYDEAAVRSLMDILDSSLSMNEREFLSVFREAADGRDIKITDELRERLLQALAE